MRRKLLWVNIALLVLAVVAVLVARNQWRIGQRRNSAARLQMETARKAGTPGNASVPGANPDTLVQVGNYNVVFERNLFSPNRTEFEAAEAVAEVPATPPMPGMPVLNGVTVVGSKRMAFIQEPRLGNQPQSRTVQIGDSLMNFGKVTEIRSDALVFSWGAETHVVDMINGGGPKVKAPITARLQTTVITVGSTRRGAPAASAPSQGGGAAGPGVQIGIVGGTGAPGQAPNGGNAAAGAQRPGGIAGAAPAQQRAGQAQAQQGAQQNQSFIETPFGRIARPQRRTN